MKEITLTTIIKECSLAELSDVDRKLVDAAKSATRNSYAPYSKFNVGAALLLANGEIVCGSNQENAAFPSGTCAERTACYYASARYPGVAMKKIAIAAWVLKNHSEVSRADIALLSDEEYEAGFQSLPISPCGACRQALLEYETLYGDIEVLLYGESKIYILPSIKSLMPLSFTDF